MRIAVFGGTGLTGRLLIAQALDEGDSVTAYARAEGLRQWSAVIVSRHLLHLGLPGGMHLDEYLAAVAQRGTGYTRQAAFAELCAFFNVSTTGATTSGRWRTGHL